jgi:hypothetical protein
MAELKGEGNIEYLDLSELLGDGFEEMHAPHSIPAVCMEYSPFAVEIGSDQTNFSKIA